MMMQVALVRPPLRDPHVVLGAEVASQRLVANLKRYGGVAFVDWPDCELPSACQPELATSSQVAFSHPTRRRASGAASWDLLHDARPVGDPRHHFHLRHTARRSFPITLTHHAVCYPQYLNGFFLPLLLANTRSYDAIICSSTAARDAIRNLLGHCAESVASTTGSVPLRFNGQLPVVPLGVDTDLYRPRDVGDVRYQLGLPPRAMVYLWVGRLSASTKADLAPLLMAFRTLRDRNPDSDVMLAIVGNDPEGYGTTLEQMSAVLSLDASVRVHRCLTSTEVHQWFAAADVFVSPIDNVQETFGLATIEAMASGIPQVVSDWSGHRDTVVHGETGYRIPTIWAECDDDAIEAWACYGDAVAAQSLLARTVACDLPAFVGHLEQLLRSPRLREAMGAASRRRALNLYSWPVVVEQHIACWQHLVDECRSAAPLQQQPPHDVVPAFGRLFAGYASTILTDASHVRLCDELRSGRSDSTREDVSAAHDGETVLEQVGRFLACSGGANTVASICDSLGAQGIGVAQSRREILQGIKYGFLELVPSS